MDSLIADLDKPYAFLPARPVPLHRQDRPPLPASAFVDIEDRQFQALRCAYARTGGLVYGDEMACLLRPHADQPVSVVARWIVARTIVNFEWRSQTFIPLFQFTRADLSLDAASAIAVKELGTVFDDWELALWFAQPNSWLHGRAPADAVAASPSEVVAAARADRFVARG